MDGKKNSACAECQRRKQKCNRQFPCNHCSKRGVAHLCQSVSRGPTSSKTNHSGSSVNDAPASGSRKRTLDQSDGEDASGLAEDADADNSAFNASDALIALGYMPHTHHLVLGRGSGPTADIDSADDTEKKGISDELKAALKEVPTKRHTDCLVDNWLNGANYHYYSLYPPEFRTQYDGWWAGPEGSRTPEITSLILRVCACSALFLADGGVKKRLESELQEDELTFANRMHNAAETLSASIPHGKGGLPHVQQLFLTAFWYKSAEKWTEAWYAVSAAVRAGFEIGLHQDPSSDGLSEFDREMRRRVWCVLYLWDFALSSMLSRPMIINRSDCNFEMPTLALEIDLEQPYQPSPFRHMKLHCQLCLNMSNEISRIPQEEHAARLAPGLRDVINRWFESLPSEYDIKQPDTRWDKDHDWVVFQRRYLQLIGYMSLFGSLKPYVTRNSANPMSELDGQLRAAGVEAALGLMDISWNFFETVASTGAKFHYAVFCIFDTTTVLCSAFVHDEARNLPYRETVLKAIKKGLSMLQGLRSKSKTTADLCRILSGLLNNLPLSSREKALIGVSKRSKHGVATPNTGNAAAASRTSRAPNCPPPPQTNEDTADSDLLSESDGNTTATQRMSGDGHGDDNFEDGQSSNGSPDGTGVSSSTSYEAEVSPPAPALPGDAGGLQPLGQNLEAMESGMMPAPPNGYWGSNLPPQVAMIRGELEVPSNPGQLSNYPYDDFQATSFDVLPVAERAWQPAGEVPNEIGYFQDANLGGFDSTVPTVLEYWDWHGLDLGHPGLWGNPHAPT
ncbi:fungal-specific transcription factor domain-containing protein [Echria macrotheca]|uniref:Fungal-specific transcription factor domain-containing protein n=1 Tax=Echria macrotheca TaxID=438768 RepID=A0AAJ0BAT5_9PEZI|nr:fungal-specific transcription factor domain-containing protein [Echria macrotheca]